MENTYPKNNPSHGLSELINKKMHKLNTVDKSKYAGYYRQTCAEIRELEYLNEGLSTLRDFGILVDIQKAIDFHQSADSKLLIVKIPLTNSPKNTHAALLDLTERGRHV